MLVMVVVVLFAGEHRSDGRKIFQDGIDRVIAGNGLGLIEESAGERCGFVQRDARTLQCAGCLGCLSKVAPQKAARSRDEPAETSASAGSGIAGRRSGRHELGGAGKKAEQGGELRIAGSGALLFDEVEEDPHAGANRRFGQAEALT